MAEAARSLIYAAETQDVEIVPATTGEDGPLIGAALASAEA